MGLSSEIPLGNTGCLEIGGGSFWPDALSQLPEADESGPRAVAAPVVELFQSLIDSLPEQTALLDEHWNILAVNEAWTKSAIGYGYFELLPGTNYRQFCEAKSAEGHTPAALVAAGIRDIEAGVRESFRFVYHGRDRWEGHAFRFCIRRLEVRGQTFATASRYEITELLKLRRLREEFGLSVMEGQADERRRMARELHDSTMQLLVALGLSIGHLKRARSSHERANIQEEMELILAEAQQELRSISYISHPPTMIQQGLESALKELVEGFGRRTGLRVALNIDAGLNLAWRSAEVALYRVVQEALSNIHRHAHATEATVTLSTRKTMIHVVVADDGIGKGSKARQGVGLPSMRSRLEELGGRLVLRRGSPGTKLIASLPWRSHIRLEGDLSVNA